jgi:hypothetical protein
MGGLAEWVDGWSRRFVYYGMGGLFIDDDTGIEWCFKSMGGLLVGGFLASSLYTSYEAKYFKMNKGGSSENSPRFISGFPIFTL